jgi:hypothetical protein
MIPLFLVSSGILSWRDVEFCQRFSCICWNDHAMCIYVLSYWFAYVEPSWNKTNFIMMYDLFNMLWDLVFKGFCLFIFVLVFWNKVLLYCPGWPGTHYVIHAHLEFLIFLPLAPKCWDFRCEPDSLQEVLGFLHLCLSKSTKGFCCCFILVRF